MNKRSPREIPLKVLSADELHAHERAGTNAYPLAQGEGVWVERFGQDYLISHLPRRDPRAAEHWLAHHLPPEQLADSRVWIRELVAKAPQQEAPSLQGRGANLLPQTSGEARELGRRYGLDFNAYTVGLFLDQAQNRAKVAQLAQPGHRLLNLFAYTCSFSVVAATSGAETVSVDLSKPALHRGRDNFRLNDVDLEPSNTEAPHHRFLADDAFAVLPRLAKRGERFDWIILDPPTFSRGKRGSKKKVFRVERDLPELIELGWPLLNPGGWFLVSTNCTTLDPNALKKMIADTLTPPAGPSGFAIKPAPTTSRLSAPGPSTAWWVQRS